MSVFFHFLITTWLHVNWYFYPYSTLKRNHLSSLVPSDKRLVWFQPAVFWVILWLHGLHHKGAQHQNHHLHWLLLSRRIWIWLQLQWCQIYEVSSEDSPLLWQGEISPLFTTSGVLQTLGTFKMSCVQHLSPQSHSFVRAKAELELAQYSLKPEDLMLHPEFLQRLRSLPQSYIYGEYRQIYRDYGTHYITEAALGGDYEHTIILNKERLEKSGDAVVTWSSQLTLVWLISHYDSLWSGPGVWRNV